MPSSWKALHAGMPQEDVEKLLRPESTTYMWGLNWEQYVYYAPMLGATSYWKLWVNYDYGGTSSLRVNGRLMDAQARFVHRFRPLSTSRELVVRGPLTNRWSR